jgi:hypothetical protein
MGGEQGLHGWHREDLVRGVGTEHGCKCFVHEQRLHAPMDAYPLNRSFDEVTESFCELVFGDVCGGSSVPQKGAVRLEDRPTIMTQNPGRAVGAYPFKFDVLE